MSRLKMYVDGLFSDYKDNQQIRDLKDEILSNLEARVADLTARGMEYNEAVEMAQENVSNIDMLIDGNKRILTNRLKRELVQIALMYSIIAWIISIPLRILGVGYSLYLLLPLVIIALVIGFLTLNQIKTYSYLNKTTIYNMQSILRYRKFVWLIWLFFIAIVTITTTATHFGSNIWYARPLQINGPYQFASIAAVYVYPGISIFLPLLFNAFVKLMNKYEAGEPYEE